jgi:hypothetical protein
MMRFVIRAGGQYWVRTNENGLDDWANNARKACLFVRMSEAQEVAKVRGLVCQVMSVDFCNCDLEVGFVCEWCNGKNINIRGDMVERFAPNRRGQP